MSRSYIMTSLMSLSLVNFASSRSLNPDQAKKCRQSLHFILSVCHIDLLFTAFGKNQTVWLTNFMISEERLEKDEIWFQGSHMLEFRGLSWKVLENFKYVLKVTGNHSKALKSPWILLFSVGINTVDRDLNQNKTVVPLFGTVNATPNKSTKILY